MKKLLRILYLLIIVLFLYLPIATLMVLSFNKGRSMSSWQGFSLKWYGEMFQNEEIINALGNTLTVALWASIIATTIGVMACIALNRMSDKKRTFFMGLNNIPLLNADIVTGIAIMMSFLMFGISLNYMSVLFAHVTFCIPYVILSVMPKFKQLENHTYEAALDLGATPTYAFFKVVLPDLMPGIMSGFLLSFTMSVDDFVITHFTRGAGINTLSTLIYSQLKIGIRPTLYALSAVIFATVFIALVLINLFTNGESTAQPKAYSKQKEYVYKAKKVNKKAITLGLTIALVLGIAIKFTPTIPGKVTEKGVVYVYNFGDYIDPDLVEEFEKTTGYTIVMDYFDTNEEMYPVVKNHTAHYDVICTSDYMVDKMIKEELLDTIDFRYVPNIKNLQNNIKNLTAGFDKDMKYAVPYTWGTYGILYNPKIVGEPEHTWKVLWDKKYEGKIVMPNSIREGNMIGAKILGYSMNTTSEKELKEITDLLIKQKPLVYSYANDNARDYMISGAAGLGVVTSGEVLYSQEANPDLKFFVPMEGTEVWTDMWSIPKTVKNKEGALKWIDFLLTENAARKNFDYLTYGIPNKTILDLTDNDILNPSDEILSKSEILINLGSEVDDMYSKYWKIFKSK